MKPLLFDSRRLPGHDDTRLREWLATEHALEPFSSVDTRATVRRVVDVGTRLGLETRVYRGGLDLGGSEVDHVWASVDGVVVDAAFPVLDPEFVDVLRRFVAGDLGADDVAGAAHDIAFGQRVIGLFPSPLRYIGVPVWTQRRRGE